MNQTFQSRWTQRLAISLLTFFSMAIFAGCIKDPAADSSTGKEETSTSPVVPSPTAAAGLPVPLDVRENLGINFAQVERRQVQDNLRVPGVFELTPGARQAYHALLAGHVNVVATPFQPVKKGDLLFTLDSPDWRRVQHEAVEAEGEIKIAEAALEVANTRLGETRTSADLANARVKNLAEVKVRKADLEAESTALNGSLHRLQAEIDAASAALDEAREHYRSRLNTLASISSIPVDELLIVGPNGESNWRGIGGLEIRAKSDGVVEDIAINEGAWLESSTLVLTVLDPAAVRFQGDAPQSELAYLKDGQVCRIVPPLGADETAITGALRVGLTAHQEDRTIPLFVLPEQSALWAKAGVTAYLEIPRENAPMELAIPTASLVQDGLDTFFFRRDPKNPDSVLRAKADLGPTDGRWVVVRSGVRVGDEVVREGAYALKLAGGANKAPEGYHFHADGTMHKNH